VEREEAVKRIPTDIQKKKKMIEDYREERRK
jgi:hypothetical protein